MWWNWREEAACRDQDTALFFPASDDDAGPAKAVCATCEVSDICLEFAMVTRQDDGVWGGLNEIERRRLRRQRRKVA